MSEPTWPPPVPLPAFIQQDAEDRQAILPFHPSMALPAGVLMDPPIHLGLLQRILPGHLTQEEGEGGVYVSTGTPRRYGNVLTLTRIDDLMWRLVPGELGFFMDFVDLVQMAYSLDRNRDCARTLATSMLRCGYAGQWPHVRRMIAAAEVFRTAASRAGGNAGKDAKAEAQKADEALWMTIQAVGGVPFGEVRP